MIKPPEGCVAPLDIFTACLRLAPSFTNWRAGRGWPAAYPDPNQLWSATHQLRPIDAKATYDQETRWAAWALTKFIMRSVGEAVALIPGRDPALVDLTQMLDLAELPDTPWFDARTGVIAWNADAFTSIIPEDFGQREIWQAWIAGLEGARLFVSADLISSRCDSMRLALGGTSGSQKMTADERRAKLLEDVPAVKNDKRKKAALKVLNEQTDDWLRDAGRSDADRLIADYFKQQGLAEYKNSRSAGEHLAAVRKERGVTPNH